MARRPQFSNFVELSGLVREQLKVLLPELRAYARNPRLIGNRLEEHSSWLSRRVLSAASNFADPYLAGMGITVERLSEASVEVVLPSRWRNHGEGGVVHVGALTTLAEFTSRLFWERHLDLGRHEMQVAGIQAHFHVETSGDTRAVMTLSEGEREAALFRFRSEGEVTVPCHVSIYESHGRLVAEVTVEWKLTRPKALGAGPSA